MHEEDQEPDRYANLRGLLALESYPHRYTHKFIGHRSASFAAAVVTLEVDFPRAQRRHVRESGGGRFVAYTYELLADSPEEIIAFIKATGVLPDLKMIL